MSRWVWRRFWFLAAVNVQFTGFRKRAVKNTLRECLPRVNFISKVLLIGDLIPMVYKRLTWRVATSGKKSTKALTGRVQVNSGLRLL